MWLAKADTVTDTHGAPFEENDVMDASWGMKSTGSITPRLLQVSFHTSRTSKAGDAEAKEADA